jgi:hypothetical protein
VVLPAFGWSTNHVLSGSSGVYSPTIGEPVGVLSLVLFCRYMN